MTHDQPTTGNSLRVLFFSVLQDATGGSREVDWEAAPGLTVEGLLEQLYASWPELRRWDGQIRVAVDLEYVERTYPLRPGQEVAVMPPVQGG
jgi:molybdopterin converting factor small subunit